MGFDSGRLILNSDNGTYYSGQTLFGKLIFDQDKVKNFRGIYVKIKGHCKVHWTSSHSRTVNGKRETYHVSHDSHEEYINQKIYLVGGEQGEHQLQPGRHEFPFQCLIPSNCPSSFEGAYGHIRYELKAVVDRAFKMDQEKQIAFRVISPLDLNADSYCKEPMQFAFEESYSCCCTSSGSMETIVKLPVSGYCPGETIPIEISCINKGTVEIEKIKLAIKETKTFYATHESGTKYENRTVAEIKKGPVPADTKRNWTVDMEVPALDVTNLAGCKYIDVEYSFKVTVSPEGCHSDTEGYKKIVIGSVPLVGYQDNGQNPLHDQMPQVTAVVDQPLNNPYPGGHSPYPPNPYPPSPYPGGNSPYPGPSPPYPGGNPPQPVASPYPSPYPPGNANPGPYPPAVSPQMNSPFPTSGHSPYPSTNPPYPSNSPYPSHLPAAAPYPVPGQSPFASPFGTGLKTGNIGFTIQGSGNNVTAPLLPPGAAVPYPTTPVASANPYAKASAPEPNTPDTEEKKPML